MYTFICKSLLFLTDLYSSTDIPIFFNDFSTNSALCATVLIPANNLANLSPNPVVPTLAFKSLTIPAKSPESCKDPIKDFPVGPTETLIKLANIADCLSYSDLIAVYISSVAADALAAVESPDCCANSF